MFEAKLDTRELTALFTRLRDTLGGDMSSFFRPLGEHLVETTKRRFDSSTGPDGKRWAPNSPVTMLRYLAETKGNYTRKGQLSKKGAARAMGKKPLIGVTGMLAMQTRYRANRDSLEIGNPMKYAAVQQFGAKKGSLGTGRYKTRNGTFPIPWGDIPARPFIGLSGDDRLYIIDKAHEFLARLAEGRNR
jgi:phage gpG-like protein